FLGQPTTCRLVSTLQDFDQISQELTKKWTSQLQECFGHLWRRKNAMMSDVKMDQMTIAKEEENLKCVNAGIVSKDKDKNSVTDIGLHPSVSQTPCCVEDFGPKCMSAIPSHFGASSDCDVTDDTDRDLAVATYSPSTDTGVATYSPSTDTVLVKEEIELNCHQEACIHQDVNRLSLKEPSLTFLHEISSNVQCELIKPTEKQSSIECSVQHNNNSCENAVVQCSCDSSLENSNVSTICLHHVCCAVTENLAFSRALTLTAAADELKTARETTMSTEAASERSVFLHKVTGDLLTGGNDTKSQTTDKTKNEASTMSSDSEMSR
ncbi:unnamed protein product, partial [Lymnaea stagnalis]